jgi:hypothetical protein
LSFCLAVGKLRYAKAGRLIRLHARPADLGDQQAADRQCVVADQLGIEPVSVLPRHLVPIAITVSFVVRRLTIEYST